MEGEDMKGESVSIFGRKLFVVVLALAFAPAPAMAFKFSDKFNPPSSAWSNTSGNWTASGGDYYAQQPNNNPEALSYLPYVFNNVSDRLTVTVNSLGDGGILFLAPKGKNYLLSVIGGSNYGQGSRGGDAGNSAYWATAADPSATFNLVTGVFSPGSTYTLTIKVDDGTFTLYKGATELTSYSDPGLTHFKVGLYDDQPNTTTGSGFGPAQSFSNFHVSGKRGPISGMEPFQASAVPEPSTWALLILGFVGLGYAGRRRAGSAFLHFG
jgi:PEP-CTERM motif